MTNETTSKPDVEDAQRRDAEPDSALLNSASDDSASDNSAVEGKSVAEAARPTVLFFSSAFCDPCATARTTLDQVSKLVPHVDYAELDVARYPDEAERAGILSTPTIVIVASNGDEVFRAHGAPTVNQMLVALAKAM